MVASNLDEFQEGGAQYTAAQTLLYENGSSYFYVNGKCEFVVSGRRWLLQEDRSGVLSTAEAEQLSRDLFFGSWDEFSGGYTAEGVYDGDVIEFIYGNDKKIACQAGCVSSSTPSEVSKMFDAAIQWRMQLHEIGKPLDGGVRVSAMKLGSGMLYGEAIVDWPLEWPLSSIATTDGNYGGAGKGTLISEEEEVEKLRKLWAAYRENFPVGGFGSSIGIRDRDEVFSLYIRDVVPVENAEGLAPWFPHG